MGKWWKRCLAAAAAVYALAIPVGAANQTGIDKETEEAKSAVIQALPVIYHVKETPRYQQIFAERKLNQALQEVNQRIAAHPEKAINYTWRSMVYGELNRLNEALADSNKAVAMRPDPLNYANRAGIYIRQKEYLPAIDDVTKAIDLSKTSRRPVSKAWLSQLYYLRGICYAALGQYDKAWQDAREEENLLPENPINDFLKAVIYEGQGEHEKALRTASRGWMTIYSVGKKKNYLQAGIAAAVAEENEKALTFLNRALQEGTDEEEAYSFRGLAYIRLAKYDEAVVDLSYALKLHEKSSNPRVREFMTSDYNNRGEAYRHLKYFTLAKKDYDKALSLAQSAREKQTVYDSMGQLAMDQGEYQKAAAYFTEALENRPYQEGYQRRSQAWRMLGENKKAEADEQIAPTVEKIERD